ncbi:MAG: SpoIID/LytB domain-containing protein [Lachnospiraceae bacterium]|nr:SpoIID/LytB domain-containing protein [Lachnospiraceae bacterium]
MRERIKEIIIRYFVIAFISIAFPYIFTAIVTGRVASDKKEVFNNFSKKVMVEFETGIVTIDVNEYIEWVLAYRINDFSEYEMLKAQSVLIRTYIYKTMADTNLINANELKLEYLSDAKQKELWGDEYINVYNYILCAINEVEEKCVYYNEDLIYPYFHFVSNGKTRNSQKEEYVKSVDSGEDILATDFVSVKNVSIEEVNAAFSGTFTANDVEILKRCDADYVYSVRVGTKIYSGEDFAKNLGLASSCFYIEAQENAIKVTCKGKGHGFGMSLYGANKMAAAGKTFEEIISYYYRNIQIKSE